MRSMFSAFCVAGFLAFVVSAVPLSREKRFAMGFAGFPFGPFAASGVGFGPQYNPYTGFGFGSPWYAPAAMDTPRPSTAAAASASNFPFNFMMVPVPQFTIPVFKNWYEGDNVCKEEKVMNAQMPSESIPAGWGEGMPDIDTDFSHQQETCKGTNKKTICVKRMMDNGEAKVIATKYECCHGFVRDPNSNSGCVETKPGSAQGGNTKLTDSDPSYYYVGNSGRSSSSSSFSSSSGGNIDKVPLQ